LLLAFATDALVGRWRSITQPATPLPGAGAGRPNSRRHLTHYLSADGGSSDAFASEPLTRLRARVVPSSAASFSGYGGRASSRSRSVNVCRTLGADLVRFGASSRALFCMILPSAFFARVQKALVYWAFSGAAGKD
jgi:hypothetical protein